MTWNITCREEYINKLRGEIMNLWLGAFTYTLSPNDIGYMFANSITKIDKQLGVWYIMKYTSDFPLKITEKHINKVNRILSKLESEYIIWKLSS